MTDPRRRTGRHFLTPENLSSTIQITNLPPEWNQDIVTSVVAGSGPVIDIKSKNDPRTGKLTGVLFDYMTSKDCKRAWEILNRIENFPVKIEQIIPSSYKNHLKEAANNNNNNNNNQNNQKQVLQLNRDSYPFEAGLELPFEMVTEVPIPRRPPPPQALNNANSTLNNTNIQFPDILSKASKHLPNFQEGSIIAPDKISQNLSRIPPLQLIEIISNLKILSNQENIQKSQLESFLNTNSDITISVTQALLEMGFIDYSVVTKVLKLQTNEASSMLSSNSTSTSNTPMGGVRNNTPLHVPSNEANNNPANMPLHVTMPMPMSTPPFIPPSLQQQPFGFVPPGSFMPPVQAPSMGQSVLMNQPNQIQQQNVGTTEAPPGASKDGNNGTINMEKLQLLPTNQQDMIKQVLTLTPVQIQSLPSDQQVMVENFRKEYIL
ncbi:pti1p [Saccharomyces arboricola H-6]|uniref:Pti1p n=1 Tax=Saccharomyces arboricola (strain H-6 / AS 2.3317 / CBS 10644) TaxID=1160507 RepID=J8LN45_SACAR|nr:pti1p [Saccharomyces arboricola H-6]